MRNYGLTINNRQDEFTCIRRNREQATLSLIDWTLTTQNVEVIAHYTINDTDLFSDHVPIMLKIKMEYQETMVLNELQRLWSNLNNDKVNGEFASRI